MIKFKLYILLFLITQLNFAQQTYQVTEGELQFINPEKGIVIKKDNLFYELKIEVVFKNKKQNIATRLELLTGEKLKTYSKKNNLLSFSEIDETYDFDKLKKISFNYIEKFKDTDYDEYKLCLVNCNFFAIFKYRHEKKEIYTTVEQYMPYVFIKFGNKKIVYTYDNEKLLIIPTKKRIKIFSLYDDSSTHYKIEKLKITNAEIYNFSQYAFSDLRDDFFKIDTLENKKVKLKNIYNTTLINQRYDSIHLDQIIKCYDKDKIDLYNLYYKKLNKFPLQASKDYRGSLQILEHNKVKWIDWTGMAIQKRLSFGIVLLPEAKRHEYKYEVNISKTDEKFILKAKNINTFGNEYSETKTDSLTLKNTLGIKNFYFQNNLSKAIISHNQAFYPFENAGLLELVDFSYEIIYFQKDNGTFGMSYLGKFLEKNENYRKSLESIEFNNFDNYQNLQFIEYKNSFYKIKKNNLYMLYSLQKDFRYKKLESFNGNFARFELPDGRKGWLDLEGREYIDE